MQMFKGYLLSTFLDSRTQKGKMRPYYQDS